MFKLVLLNRFKEKLLSIRGSVSGSPLAEVFLFLCWLVPRFIRKKIIARRSGGTGERPQAHLRYITYAQTPEGIGGVVLKCVAAIALSRIFGVTYLRKKFPPDFHHPELDFDEFLSFGEGELASKGVEEVTS